MMHQKWQPLVYRRQARQDAMDEYAGVSQIEKHIAMLEGRTARDTNLARQGEREKVAQQLAAREALELAEMENPWGMQSPDFPFAPDIFGSFLQSSPAAVAAQQVSRYLPGIRVLHDDMVARVAAGSVASPVNVVVFSAEPHINLDATPKIRKKDLPCDARHPGTYVGQFIV